MPNVTTRPNWRQAMVGIPELIEGFNLAEYLYKMEVEGWSLVALTPIFSKVLIIHRREETVVEPEAIQSSVAVPQAEAGQGQAARGTDPEAGTWHPHPSEDA